MRQLKLQFLAEEVDHDDAMPLTVLFSVLALSLSLIERTPESMGEDTVQSIREEGVASVEAESVMEDGTESKTRRVADRGSVSVTVRVVDSRVELRAMSVTGRMEGDCAALLTVFMTARVEESSEPMHGGGVFGGKTYFSSTQGEVESN